MSPGGYGGVDASLGGGGGGGGGKRFSEAIAAHSRDNQLPSEELSEAWARVGTTWSNPKSKNFEASWKQVQQGR